MVSFASYQVYGFVDQCPCLSCTGVGKPIGAQKYRPARALDCDCINSGMSNHPLDLAIYLIGRSHRVAVVSGLDRLTIGQSQSLNLTQTKGLKLPGLRGKLKARRPRILSAKPRLNEIFVLARKLVACSA